MSSDSSHPSLRSGIFWSLATFVAAKSITFLSTLVLARLVAPSDFGALAAVLAYIGLLELLSDLGMGATIVYEAEQGITRRVETAFTLNLLLSVALTGIGVALAPLIADFFNAGGHTGLFRLVALDITLTALGNVHDSLLLRGMEFRKRIVPQLSANSLRAVVSITLVAVGLGASGLVIGFIAGTAAWTVSLWVITRWRPRLTIERGAVRSMLSYGGWASFLDILVVVGNKADVAVIGRILGQGALGIYVIAQRLPELVVENVAWNLSAVAFPALARRRDEEGGMARTALNLIRYGALFGLPVGAGIAILATPLVVVLFGDKWGAAGRIMTLLAIMYGLHAMVTPLGDVLKALGRQWIIAAINMVAIPTAIVAMVLTAPKGLFTLVLARVLVACAQGFFLFGVVLRMLGLRLLPVLALLRASVATTVGVVAGALPVRLLWNDLAPGPLIAGAVAGAVLGLALLRLFGHEEWEQLRAIVASRVGGGAAAAERTPSQDHIDAVPVPAVDRGHP